LERLFNRQSKIGGTMSRKQNTVIIITLLALLLPLFVYLSEGNDLDQDFALVVVMILISGGVLFLIVSRKKKR
ncbi:MAG: hypothetical protein ABIE92_11990, partial [bacterium]